VRANASTTRSLHSGQLARLAGISPDTLRFYERRRLLPSAPRTASGYRLFPPEALARVKLIRAALSIGFSVDELAAILGERNRGGVHLVVASASSLQISWLPSKINFEICNRGGVNCARR
jgi:DNA-binding transcriptional MerR regulator